MTQKHSINDLLELMTRLRHPNLGCSWDKKQNWRSLTSHTLEEVYEVVDAVESDDSAQVMDELGDLLFQIVFYAQIAQEEGKFEFDDVARAITAKLLRRHPHVFPDATLESFGSSAINGISAEQVALNWELIKNQEREGKAKAGVKTSVMDDVPASLPALNRAGKLQKRAASEGFDWQSAAPVLAKLQEEIQELEAEIAAGCQEQIVAELGDVLFTCVNLARHLQVEPETALRSSNLKFERRFRALEQKAAESNFDLANLTETELNIMWNEIKRAE